MDCMDLTCYNSRLEINLSRIQQNIQKIESYCGLPLMPVIKSNAYGFGTAALARFLTQDCGIKLLAVARVFEACQILNAGCRDAALFILGPVPAPSIPLVVAHDLQMPLFRESDTYLLSEEASRQGKERVRVHLKLETGMNRIGVKPGAELNALLRCAKKLKNLEIVGVFTHFATADQANKGAGNPFTKEQFARFLDGLQQVRAAGISPQYIHCCNTGATTWLKEAYEVCTHVRAGSLFLGYPSIQDNWNPISVEESGSWKTCIVHIKNIQPGESVGYGRSFKPSRPTKIAVIGIGYGDGYLRSFAMRGAPALVHGVRCPFVSICMDMGFLDVTDIDCQVGDEVTLFGTDEAGNALPGLEIGHLMGETRLAMFSHITERVVRTYSTNNGQQFMTEKDFLKSGGRQ